MSEQKEAKPSKPSKPKPLEPTASLNAGAPEPHVHELTVGEGGDEGFAKNLTDKLSYATMPGARNLAGVVGDAPAQEKSAGNNGGSPPANTADLAKVVGDPHAEERHWYPAAEAAGDKDLSGAPSKLKVWMFRAAAFVGVFFSFASIMLCYVASIFFASDVGALQLRLPTDMFLNALVGLDYMGFLIAGAAAITFWAAFFGFYKRSIRYFAIALFIYFGYQALDIHFKIGPLPTFAWAIVYLPALYLLEWIGGSVREALPMHIGSKRLAAVLMPALAFPAMAMVATFFIATNPGYSQPTHYAQGSLETLAFNTISVFLCTLIPGFVLARSTNLKSPSGAATLATLLQTPLLLGLLLTTVSCVVLAIAQSAGVNSEFYSYMINMMGGGNWTQYGLPKAIAVLSAAALAAASAATGGALGAWCNNHFKDKKDEKPVEMG